MSVHDPFHYISKTEMFTVVVLTSFISWKFLNVLYEQVYQPTIEGLIDTYDAKNYYINIGPNGIPIGKFILEFIKWLILIIVLMVIYNHAY